MTRVDMVKDARRVMDALLAGGLAVVPGDVGYGFVAASAPAMLKGFHAKKRAAHKRHGMMGSLELHRQIHILDDEREQMIEALIFDYNLPIGVIAPIRPDHPMIGRIDEGTLRQTSVEGTMAMILNNGRFQHELATLCLEEGVPLLGSSANITGTGTRFRIEDVQPEVLEIADVVIDYGLRKFHHYKRSSTMINFSTMQVVRIGACYELISDALRRDFGVELPPDPGQDVLPSGHLWEPDAPTTD